MTPQLDDVAANSLHNLKNGLWEFASVSHHNPHEVFGYAFLCCSVAELLANEQLGRSLSEFRDNLRFELPERIIVNGNLAKHLAPPIH